MKLNLWGGLCASYSKRRKFDDATFHRGGVLRIDTVAAELALQYSDAHRYSVNYHSTPPYVYR